MTFKATIENERFELHSVAGAFKRQHGAPNVHNMLTNLANARFPGPMSWKNLMGERLQYHRNAWFYLQIVAIAIEKIGLQFFLMP